MLVKTAYHYTDDTAMTLAMAHSLIRQPAAAKDVGKFDATDMADGYSLLRIFSCFCTLQIIRKKLDEFWKSQSCIYTYKTNRNDQQKLNSH